MHQSTLKNIPLYTLRPLLKDVSPSVRVVVAELLAQRGTPEDTQQALSTLLKLCDTSKHHPIVATFALNAIDYLGETARPVYETLESIPPLEKKPQTRTQWYPARLISIILEN